MNEKLSRVDRNTRHQRDDLEVTPSGFIPRSQRGRQSNPKTVTTTETPLPQKEDPEFLLSDTTLEEEELSLLSRSELFPSHRIKWTKWFFNVLLVIFIALTIWLLWWGLHDSPWSAKQDL